MSFTLATFNALDFFDDGTPDSRAGADPQLPLVADRMPSVSPASRPNARRVAEYQRKLDAMSAVVQSLDADVIAWQEVQNARVLDDLRRRLAARGALPFGGYLDPVAASANPRGIACGLLSRLPIRTWTEHAPTSLPMPAFVELDAPAFVGRLRLRRAAIEATIELPDGTLATVVVVHFKSALPTPAQDAAGNDVPIVSQRDLGEARVRSAVVRMAEALYIRGLVDAQFDRDPNSQIAVAGDFNDVEGSAVHSIVGGARQFDTPLAAIREASGAGVSSLRRLAARALRSCAESVPEPARFTSVFRGARAMIDHILVSESLAERLESVRIVNETLVQQVSNLDRTGASDHAPVVAHFRCAGAAHPGLNLLTI